MNNSELSRKAKIELLKNIAAGRVSVEVLKPCTYLVRVGYGNPSTTQFFLNGERVNKDAYHARLQQEPAYKKGEIKTHVSFSK